MREQITHIVPWVDIVVDALGQDPRSSYVERFWLPVVGPSGILLLRQTAHRFDEEPAGFSVDLAETARSLGVGSRKATSASMSKTLERLERFKFARQLTPDRLAVRRQLPTLHRRLVRNLPMHLQVEHDRWAAEQQRRSTHPASIGHATRLARSLHQVGADRAELVAQLLRWNFDAETAERAATDAIRDADDTPMAANG